MTRTFYGTAAATAALAILVAASAPAQERDFSKVEIKATKVSGNVWMLEGAGGNIGASIGDDGVVLVDDQFAPLADKIRAALKANGAGEKPVRFVLNTHYHFDHTGGNAPFASTGATVVAHDNVRKRLETGGRGGNTASIKIDVKPAEKAALPVVTFGNDLTIHANGEAIRALHFTAGHTDGDVVVYFPKANVVHMGDQFVRYGFPFVDVDAGGSVLGIAQGTEDAIAKLPADVKVIPGHGAVSNLDDVRAYVKMIRETVAVVKKEMGAGKSVDDMKKAKVLEAWQKWSGDFVSTDAWIETVHASLSGKGGVYRPHN